MISAPSKGKLDRKRKLVRKGKVKVYTGEIPNLDVEIALRKSRSLPRL